MKVRAAGVDCVPVPRALELVHESFGSTFKKRRRMRPPQSTIAKVDVIYSGNGANKASTYGMGRHLALKVPSNQQSDEVQARRTHNGYTKL